MRADLLRLAADLSERGEPFVLATVVRREAPSSARLGDSALITSGGSFHGFLGGSCTQPSAVCEALRALSEGTPRLVALSPDPGTVDRPGVVVLPMTCHSGGSVDIYLEPVLPAPRLLVYGVSPTASAVVRIGKVLGYSVEAVDPGADRTLFPEADRIVTDWHAPGLKQRTRRDDPGPYVVVATLGEDDAEAIRAALQLQPAYLGVVASRTRFARLREALQAHGVPAERVDAIRSPAGLDIGAVTPEEIALSVLAEMVERRRSATVGGPGESSPTGSSEAVDPVCGMTVSVKASGSRAEVRGRTYYFCCRGCRERFLADPEQFLASGTGGAV